VSLKPFRHVSGIVINDIGEPIEGANVQILKASMEVLAVTSGKSGKFSVPKLGPGDYEVIAKAPGYTTAASFHIAVVKPKASDRRMLEIRLLVTNGCPGIRRIRSR
jgi:hypothetical protein